METKQWWRPTEQLYNFIMQCAGRADENGRAIEIRGLLEDSDVIAGFNASSHDFEKRKLDSLCFSIASYNEIPNIEQFVEEGMRRFGGHETLMNVIFTYGAEWRKTARRLSPAKINIFGFPSVYRVKQVNLVSDKETLITEAYGSSAFTHKIAAEMYADAMGRCHDEIIESKNKHGFFEIAYNGERRKNSIIIKRGRSIFSGLNQENINEIGDFLARTRYCFRGKEWKIGLMYEGDKDESKNQRH